MAFVGQTSNPWDVPVKQALNVMQKIWDACSAYKYEITTSCAVYQKVRVFIGSEMMLIQIYLRRFSALWTRGATSLDPTALWSLWLFSTPNLNYGILILVAKNSPGITSKIFVFYIKTLITRTGRYVILNTIIMSNLNTPFRNGRGSFAVPSSSKPLLLTLLLLKVPRMFLTSMTINQFL